MPEDALKTLSVIESACVRPVRPVPQTNRHRIRRLANRGIPVDSIPCVCASHAESAGMEANVSKSFSQQRTRVQKLERTPPMPKQHKVGDHVLVKLSGGRIEQSVVRAVIETTGGLKLQLDFGHEETALVHEWQVVEEGR